MPPYDGRGFGMRVWIVVGVQAIAMLVCAVAFGTWHDEEYTLATTARGPGYAFHRAIDFELQPPLYFVVLAALRTLTSSVFFARVFSVACALVASLAMAAIARRIWPRQPAWPLVALVAFNPFTVYAALEIRLYAFALALSVLAWLAFDDGFFSRTSTRARLAFVAIAVASLWTQYFLAFEFVAFAVALAIVRKWRALGAFIVVGVVVAALFLPLGVFVHAQVGNQFAVPDALLPSPAAVFMHPLIDFVLPLGYERFGGTVGYVAVLASALVLVAAIVVGRPRLDRRTSAIIAMALVVEAIYVVLADVLRYELVAPRHFIALFVPEVVAAYALVAAFASPYARAAGATMAVTIALATAATVGWTYHTGAKQGDWPRVGALLSTLARPGDVIAVTEADSLPAFERYYHGSARVVPFPRPLPPDRYDVDAMYVHGVADGESALARLPHDDRVWLVIYGRCDQLDQLGCHELETALARHERVLEKHVFYLNEVLRIAPR